MKSQAVTDQFGRSLRDLRISVLDQCNYRCPYCMPAETFHEGYEFLRKRERLDFDEIETVARAAVSLGTEKLRLTGGEPLLRRNLPELVERLAQIEGVTDLALTTNAQLLEGAAQPLARAGLNRVTVSLDSVNPEIFSRMSGGRGDLQQVLAGIDAAVAAGLAPIKINTVVQRGVNDHSVMELLEHFRGSGHIVRLIEYMDVGNRNGWRLDDVISAATLKKQIHNRWPLIARSPLYAGEVARRYAYADGEGEIGFITSVTQPFCGGCHRARLSADGVLYTCLFATAGTPLREALRAGEDVAQIAGRLEKVWGKRSDRYSEQRSAAIEPGKEKKVEMFRVGG